MNNIWGKPLWWKSFCTSQSAEISYKCRTVFMKIASKCLNTWVQLAKRCYLHENKYVINLFSISFNATAFRRNSKLWLYKEERYCVRLYRRIILLAAVVYYNKSFFRYSCIYIHVYRIVLGLYVVGLVYAFMPT